jgi:hypothetical protein
MANNLEDIFVPKEQSQDLKDLGFDERCVGYYDEEGLLISIYNRYDGNKNSSFPEKTNNPKISAPTWEQAFTSLLNKHSLYGLIIPTITMNWTFKTMTVVQNRVEVPPYKHVDANDYGTYEKARKALLIKLIELCKQN